MNKKYQIFVSSTYEDLQIERQEVMNALLELDCIPAGMELFPAANEDQWSLIKGVIDDCDYYIVISAGRYGSIGPDGISYTEMEYRYAIEQRKPVIAFLHKDLESLPKKVTESSTKGQQKLKEFRQLMEKRMCKYWETAQELGSAVSRSLIMLQRKHPGIGWVRGDLVPDKEASLEILNLRKEIERLEAHLEQARTQAPPGTERLAQGDDEFEFYYNVSSSDKTYKRFSWKGSIKKSWNEIFYAISPLMIQEATDYELIEALKQLITREAIASIRKKHDLQGHSFQSFSVERSDFHTVKVQLLGLGLIAKSTRNRSVKDTNSYWTLTPYGDGIMNKLRAIPRESDNNG